MGPDEWALLPETAERARLVRKHDRHAGQVHGVRVRGLHSQGMVMPLSNRIVM